MHGDVAGRTTIKYILHCKNPNRPAAISRAGQVTRKSYPAMRTTPQCNIPLPTTLRGDGCEADTENDLTADTINQRVFRLDIIK